jgi:hypothetical protein
MAIGHIRSLIPFINSCIFFRYGFKKTILVGMLAWAIRYVLFAYGNGGDLSFMLIIGIALHGICYDFLFRTNIYQFKSRRKVQKLLRVYYFSNLHGGNACWI